MLFHLGWNTHINLMSNESTVSRNATQQGLIYTKERNGVKLSAKLMAMRREVWKHFRSLQLSLVHSLKATTKDRFLLTWFFCHQGWLLLSTRNVVYFSVASFLLFCINRFFFVCFSSGALSGGTHLPEGWVSWAHSSFDPFGEVHLV